MRVVIDIIMCKGNLFMKDVYDTEYLHSAERLPSET